MSRPVCSNVAFTGSSSADIARIGCTLLRSNKIPFSMDSATSCPSLNVFGLVVQLFLSQLHMLLFVVFPVNWGQTSSPFVV
ncbi:MAG: hypothetical protein ACP5E8_06595 [Thermoplasmata archaeon]